MIEGNEVLNMIKNIFEDIETDNFDLETNFKNNAEWDSMTALTLITLLDQEFNVSINGEKLKKLDTIKDLINYINE